MTEKRYLVYKSWNGRVHISIEYVELTNGEDKVKRDPLELKRVEITHDTNDLKLLKILYPLEDKREISINS